MSHAVLVKDCFPECRWRDQAYPARVELRTEPRRALRRATSRALLGDAWVALACKTPTQWLASRGFGFTQNYEGTNQVQRIVMARQLLR